MIFIYVKTRIKFMLYHNNPERKEGSIHINLLHFISINFCQCLYFQFITSVALWKITTSHHWWAILKTGPLASHVVLGSCLVHAGTLSVILVYTLIDTVFIPWGERDGHSSNNQINIVHLYRYCMYNHQSTNIKKNNNGLDKELKEIQIYSKKKY